VLKWGHLNTGVTGPANLNFTATFIAAKLGEFSAVTWFGNSSLFFFQEPFSSAGYLYGHYLSSSWELDRVVWHPCCVRGSWAFFPRLALWCAGYSKKGFP